MLSQFTADSPVADLEDVLNPLVDAINDQTAEHYTTAALLLASAPVNGSLARANDVPGAWFERIAGAWVMQGVARFATSTARNSALTAPAVNWRSKLDTELFIRRATGSGTTWVPNGSGTYAVLPSAATNGSVSSDGKVTSTAQTLVRVRDAFPTDFTRFKITFDISTSAAASLLCVLAVSATDAITAYDNQHLATVNATNTAVQGLNTTAWTISGTSIIGRHVGTMELWGPNAAAATEYMSRAWSTANPATSSSGLYTMGGQHQTATAYDSITFKAGSGNVTINSLSIEGIGVG